MKDCGVACIQMIIENYDGFINYEKLCDMTKTNKNGTTAYNIVDTLKKLGFNSYGIHYKLDSHSNEIVLPAIAHVVIDNMYNHFVIIYEINYKKNYLIIADPARKIEKISIDEFKKIFSNVILVAYPIRKIEKENKIKIGNYIKQILFNKKYLNIFLVSMILLIISFIYLILIKYFLNGNFKINLLVLILTIILGKYICNYIKNKKSIKYKIDIYKNLMTESFFNILNLPYKYYRNHTTGDIISRINDAEKIKDFVDVSIVLLTDVVLFVLSSFLLLAINKILFLMVIIILLLYLLNYLCHHKKVEQKLEDVKLSKSMINSFVTESILGYESIKGQNLENTIKEQFETKNLKYLNDEYKYEFLYTNMQLINNFLSDISVLLIFGVGICLINKKAITYGDLIIFYTIMNYFIEPVKHFNEISIIIQEIRIAFKRLINLKYLKYKINNKSDCGDIFIKKLNFEIDDKKIINDLTLNIKKNEKIMITGKSGSGKSTLLKIIKQFYSSNNIYVNNKSIKELNMKDNITYISQNEHLFTNTLYNNITMHKKLSEKKVKEIIKICELENIVSNKMGLNLLIEENGFNLSGGEKQRIILARSLVNIKDYLFIDEGLSEVSVDMERRILKKLFSTYKNKTIIVVSHRLDNLDLFDKLIELDKNEIIERR